MMKQVSHQVSVIIPLSDFQNDFINTLSSQQVPNKLVIKDNITLQMRI